MAHVLRDIEAVVLLVAVVVNLLDLAHKLIAGTEQFRFGHAVLAYAHEFLHHYVECFGIFAGFGKNVYRKRIFGLADNIIAVAATGGGEGAVGLLRQFVKAGVDDIATEVHHQFYDVLHLRAANLIGHGVGLEEYLHNAGSLFLVLIYNINRLLGVGHGVVLVSGSVFRHLDGREDFLDALLYLIDVDVAHHDNALQVGAIPLLVIVAQFLRLEVIDNAHKADGEAFAVARAGIEFRQAALHNAH